VPSIYVAPWRIDLTVRPSISSPVPGRALAREIGAALVAVGAPHPASVGLTLTDDRELGELNERHMGEYGPTDVLSFPILPPSAFATHPGEPERRSAAADFPLPPGARQPLGDIVVSVERAIAQAERGLGGQTGDVQWSPADELRLLVTHGTLHLCGWDHAEPAEATAMRDLERRLLGQAFANAPKRRSR
jgi:probable rRNA maturation factor